MINWLRKHKAEAQFTAFAMMILASIGMYTSISSVDSLTIWVSIGIFILGNIIALLIR